MSGRRDYVSVYHATDHGELLRATHVLDDMGVHYLIKGELAAVKSPSATGEAEVTVMAELGRARECVQALEAEFGSLSD